MDNFKNNSLQYSETETSEPTHAEQLTIRKDEALGGGASDENQTRRVDETTDTLPTGKDNRPALAEVRSALHDVRDHAPATSEPATPSSGYASSDQEEPGEEKKGYLKRIVSELQAGVAKSVYAFLGDRTPRPIKNHVPVYRSVVKKYAGQGNAWGKSEWTIGAYARQQAVTKVNEHRYNPNDADTHPDDPEVVAIRSTLGELERQKNAKVMKYGSFGSERLKVVVNHTPDTRVKHKIIKSSKDNKQSLRNQ